MAQKDKLERMDRFPLSRWDFYPQAGGRFSECTRDSSKRENDLKTVRGALFSGVHREIVSFFLRKNNLCHNRPFLRKVL